MAKEARNLGANDPLATGNSIGGISRVFRPANRWIDTLPETTTLTDMWKKPAIYFSLGLSAGILLCLAWPRGSATAEAAKGSAVPSGAGLGQTHGNAIPAAAPSVTQIFHDGPLADEAFWAALGKSPEARRAAFQRKTGEILSSPRLAMRRRWFIAMLENYQSGDLAAIHAGMIDQERLGGRFNKEYEDMMERASEVDGDVVLDKINRESGGPGRSTHSWQARCMASWSGAESDKATAWWNNLPDGHLRDFLATPLIEGLAAVNAEKAWQAAQLFDPGKRAEFAARLATAFAKERGPEASVAWVAGLGPEESQSKANALTEMADHMHNMSHQKQAELFGQFASEPWAANTSAFATLGTYWVMKDANTAVAWADNLPENARKQALPAVIARWTANQEDQAGAWIESQRNTPDFAMKSQVFLQQLRQKQSPAYVDWTKRLGVAQ